MSPALTPSSGWSRLLIDPVRLITAQGAVPVPPTPWRLDEPGPGLLLDFGRELHGGIQVTASPDDPPCILTVRLGESVAEALSADFEGEEISLRPGEACEYGRTGFRFASLAIPPGSSPATLAAAQAVAHQRDLARRGSFTSSDDRLDRLWQCGADTVLLCLQDHFWDGIKRDRLPWAGDLYPAARTAAAVFGDLPVVRATLDHLRDTTPPGAWVNDIAAYSLWWIVVHRDLFRHHGDLDVRHDRDTAGRVHSCFRAPPGVTVLAGTEAEQS